MLNYFDISTVINVFFCLTLLFLNLYRHENASLVFALKLKVFKKKLKNKISKHIVNV